MDVLLQYSLITSYFNLNVSQPGFFPEAESICGSGLSFIIVKQRLFGVVWPPYYGVWPYVWATIAKIAQGIDDDNLFGMLGRRDPALRRSAAVVLVILLLLNAVN